MPCSPLLRPRRPHAPRAGVSLGVLDGISLGLLLCALIPVAQVFGGPDFPGGHDAGAHLTMAYRFDRAFAQGQIPVRWVEGIRNGTGQPLFNFYQVGFYYIVELVRQMGLPLSSAFRLAPLLLWSMAGTFAWLWLRPLGLAAATVGSVSFVLSPYLTVDVFIRAAYPEFAAIAFAVGALWAVDAFLRTGRRRYLALTSILVALMLISHLPATLIASPAFLAVVWTRVSSDPASRVRLRRVAVGALLGGGLAAFYVLPALMEHSLVRMRQLTTNGLDFHGHFVPAWLWTQYLFTYDWHYGGASVTDPKDLMPLQVNLFQWLALIGATGTIVWAAVTRRWLPITGALAGWLLVVACSLFMMHESSVAIWHTITPLAFIQFPWRFFLLTSIGSAMLLALLVSRVRNTAAQTILVIAIVAAHLHLYPRRLQPAMYLSAAEWNIDNPAWPQSPDARRVGYDERAYDPLGVHRGSRVDSRWVVRHGRAHVRELQMADARMALEVTAREPSIVRLHTRMFPRWRASIDGAPTTIRRTPVEGYIEIAVPAGVHVVEAWLEDTPVRTAATALSLLSAAAIGFGTIRRRSATRVESGGTGTRTRAA